MSHTEHDKIIVNQDVVLKFVPRLITSYSMVMKDIKENLSSDDIEKIKKNLDMDLKWIECYQQTLAEMLTTESEHDKIHECHMKLGVKCPVCLEESK